MSERIQYIEIDVSRCSLVYGNSPCTAVLGVTGTDKCFNCFATCQDQANYDEEIETLRFNEPSDAAPISIDSIPNISGVSLSPAKLDLGKSIGVRATLSVGFKDHRYPDTGVGGDKYLSDRDYDPYQQGTYWGKFRARWPYLEDAPIRWIQGTPDLTLAQMETRHFIIDSYSGPDINGNFSIKAKDALRLADGKKALAPMLSIGKLSADIAAGVTSVTLNPVGVGATYATSGQATIGGNEMVSFTRVGDVFTIVRGINNTEDVEHKTDDAFQEALVYAPQDAALILDDLLSTYANVPASFIPTSSWQAETATYNGSAYSAIIPLPTPVTDLVNEVLEQLVAAMWWNDSTKLLNLRILREVSGTATQYNHDSILEGSINITDQLKKRVSQVWTYYGQINPLEKINETKNYRSTLVTVSSESELNFPSSSVRQIFSRWIPQFGGSIAGIMNDLILSRYALPPRLIGFRLLRDSGVIKPELGGGYKVLTSSIQDATGLDLETDIQAVTVKSDSTYHEITAEEVVYNQIIPPVDANVRTIPISSSTNNFNVLDAWNEVSTVAPSSLSQVTIDVYEGIIVGSESTSLPAFRTGIWPVGATITINNFGRIQGKGGAGGNGGRLKKTLSTDIAPGFDGLIGGDALLIEHDTAVDNLNGKIWSGGGGGGCGGASDLGGGKQAGAGAGGGGGQGVLDSEGGIAGLASDLSNPTIDANNGSIGNDVDGGNGGAAITGQNGGAGGKGGLAGFNGTDGQDGPYPLTAGGSGGAAGDAIVQSGATATIINAGDIRGAIV
jgi:hypothetical protein